MAKTKKTENIADPEENQEDVGKENNIASVIESIRDMPHSERVILYQKLSKIIEYDRDKASVGIDAGTEHIQEVIDSL